MGLLTPPPPPSRTRCTCLVPPPVLTGHASSLLRRCDTIVGTSRSTFFLLAALLPLSGRPRETCPPFPPSPLPPTAPSCRSLTSLRRPRPAELTCRAHAACAWRAACRPRRPTAAQSTRPQTWRRTALGPPCAARRSPARAADARGARWPDGAVDGGGEVVRCGFVEHVSCHEQMCTESGT